MTDHTKLVLARARIAELEQSIRNVKEFTRRHLKKDKSQDAYIASMITIMCICDEAVGLLDENDG